MKKILTIILSMVLLLSAASVITYAEEPTAVDDNTLYTTRITATTVTHTVKYIPDNGIISGYPDGYFRPYDSVTRAEIITMIDRNVSNTN